jgi:hypothetical protein
MQEVEAMASSFLTSPNPTVPEDVYECRKSKSGDSPEK